MSKTNRIKVTIKTVIDIFYKNTGELLSTVSICAKYYNVTDKIYKEFPRGIKNKDYKMIKKCIHPAREYFRENGEFLISDLFDGERYYVLVNSADKFKKYIIKELEKNIRRKIRAGERLDMNLYNVKERGLLPKYEIKRLEEPDLDLPDSLKRVHRKGQERQDKSS